MDTLTEKEKKAWNRLKGFTDPVIQQYFKKHPDKEKKYQRIQDALNSDQVVFKIIKAERAGPGFIEDDYKIGLEKIREYLPRRVTTIPSSLAEIETNLKNIMYTDVPRISEPVTWSKMYVAYRIAITRYGADIALGADVVIDGIAGDNEIRYFYDNTGNAEGSQRYVIINGKRHALNGRG